MKMGTRGLIGFYRDGVTKATYNHYDSYPSHLGITILKEVKSVSIKKLNETFDRIKLVTEDKKPKKEEIKRYKKLSNLGVSTQKITEWYCLLRKAQGTLKPYVDEQIDHMISNSNFIKDSLFCEWAYIVNLDKNTLEVWRGFRDKPNSKRNRYRIEEPDEQGYYACELLKEFPLNKLPTEKKFLGDLQDGKM